MVLWRSSGKDAKHLVNLFQLHDLDNTKGVNSRRLDPTYIKNRVYGKNKEFFKYKIKNFYPS